MPADNETIIKADDNTTDKGTGGAGDSGGADDKGAGGGDGDKGDDKGSANDKGAGGDDKGAGDDKGKGAADDKTKDDKGAGGADDKGKKDDKKAGDDKAGQWPANWRAELAGDDKKLLAQLERFTSPVDLAKKIREQDATITKLSTAKAGLPKDATAEQVAQFRKDNDIPETADKYDLTLPDGLVIGEADKPVVDGMLNAMHGANLNQAQVKTVITEFYKREQEFLQERIAKWGEEKKAHDDELHKEWGQEYRQNVNAVNNLSATFSMETRAMLASALDSDGNPLLNNRHFIKDMCILARAVNPIDTVVGATGGNQMSSVDDEIKKIEARFGGTKEERDAYYKDEKAQARYRELLDWKDKQRK